MDIRVMVIDDEQDFLDSAKRGLALGQIHDVRLESDPRSAAAYFEQGGTADVALVDVSMPGVTGIELLDIIRRHSPATQCIMITAHNDARTAVECVRRGAYDYLLKPLSMDDLMLAIKRAVERMQLLEIAALGKTRCLPQLKNPEAFSSFNTKSQTMLRMLREAELHAVSDVPVLITGETGTGKELLARAVHRLSGRSGGVFTPVNMAAITPSLFDAEFFGHTRGAFTGADKDRAGYIEHTNGGSIFLDEIGTLSLDLQGKLLRALQEQEYYKIGSSMPRKADVRYIAATNIDIEKMTAKGGFRNDLYYRLKGAWLHVPPLRERREDIPLLVSAFLKELCTDGKPPAVSDEAMELLISYDYPGNVRELKSCVHSAVNLAHGSRITPQALPGSLQKRRQAAGRAPLKNDEPVQDLEAIERAHILKTYDLTGRNKARTAELLSIGLNTLRRKLKTYGVE